MFLVRAAGTPSSVLEFLHAAMMGTLRMNVRLKERSLRAELRHRLEQAARARRLKHVGDQLDLVAITSRRYSADDAKVWQ